MILSLILNHNLSFDKRIITTIYEARKRPEAPNQKTIPIGLKHNVRQDNLLDRDHPNQQILKEVADKPRLAGQLSFPSQPHPQSPQNRLDHQRRALIPQSQAHPLPKSKARPHSQWHRRRRRDVQTPSLPSYRHNRQHLYLLPRRPRFGL